MTHGTASGSIALVVGCALALAACGSSAKSSTAAASAGFTQGVRYSDCMRSHGVPGFPDPSANGELALGPGSGVNPQSPAFQSAQAACAKLQPGGNGPPQMSESQKLAALKFAQCMRRHGVANFPDPGAPKGSTSVLAVRGMFFPFSGGLQPNAPAFRRAAASCGVRPPNASS